jgi:hypothetical protein
MEMDVGPSHHDLQNFVEAVETDLIRDLNPSPNRRSDPFQGDLQLINEIGSPCLPRLLFLCRLLSHLLLFQFLSQALSRLEKRQLLGCDHLFFTGLGVSARVSFVVPCGK